MPCAKRRPGTSPINTKLWRQEKEGRRNREKAGERPNKKSRKQGNKKPKTKRTHNKKKHKSQEKKNVLRRKPSLPSSCHLRHRQVRPLFSFCFYISCCKNKKTRRR